MFNKTHLKTMEREARMLGNDTLRTVESATGTLRASHSRDVDRTDRAENTLFDIFLTALVQDELIQSLLSHR